METWITLIGIGIAGVTAFLAHCSMQRAKRLEAHNDYLRKALDRRQALQGKRDAITAATTAARAEVAEEHKAAIQAVRDEVEKVHEDERKEGLARAASAHVRRMRDAGLAVLICAFVSAPLTGRADPCDAGYTVMRGEVAPCDAECLPEDDLRWLLGRSKKLLEVEAELTAEQKQHALTKQEQQDMHAACQAAFDDLEASCDEAVRKSAGGWSTSTYILIGVGIFITGMTLGALAYDAIWNSRQ